MGCAQPVPLVVDQGPQPLSFLAIVTVFPAVSWLPDAWAGDTEVTMVSATAATTAPNHFFAVGVIIMVSFGPGDLAFLIGRNHCAECGQASASRKDRE